MFFKSKLFLAFFSFFALACICTPTLLFPSTQQPTEFSPTSPIIATPTMIPCQGNDCQATCPVLLEEILSASNGSGSPLKTFSGSTESSSMYNELVRYRVSGDDLVGATYLSAPPELDRYKQDTASHQSTWELFTSIIPPESRQMVTEYLIFTDGSMDLLAAVEQNSSEEDTWSLEVDIIDARDRKALSATILHEFAHLLTLNMDQAELDNYLCPVEYVNPGCGKPGSYVDSFYQRFWVDIYAEWEEINTIPDEDEKDQQLSSFYGKYETQFLSEYSTTDAAEDIAEAWMYYILVPKPDGDTIADQKILFFYDYPELVQLREDILPRLCQFFQTTTSP